MVSGGKKSIYYSYGHKIQTKISSNPEDHSMDQDVFTSFEEIKFDDFCFPIGHLDKIKHKTN